MSSEEYDGPLRHDGCNDYTMLAVENSAWITINNISVYLRRTDEGVAVALYPRGRELDDEIVGTWALFSEAEYDNEHEDRDVGRGQEINRDLPGTQLSD